MSLPISANQWRDASDKWRTMFEQEKMRGDILESHLKAIAQEESDDAEDLKTLARGGLDEVRQMWSYLRAAPQKTPSNHTVESGGPDH